jgi:hypothetical protein
MIRQILLVTADELCIGDMMQTFRPEHDSNPHRIVWTSEIVEIDRHDGTTEVRVDLYDWYGFIDTNMVTIARGRE